MPADPTASQSAASRLNALHSTGPVTAKGKAAASRNAVRHGLRGAVIEIFAEEQELLADILASLQSRWQTADAIERGLVQAMAVLELKLVRLDAIELQVLAGSIEDDLRRLPALNTLLRYRSRLLKERWETELRLHSAIAQRCTNEAARKKGLAACRERLEQDEQQHAREQRADAIIAQAARQKPELNREQRRRLEAVQRKAA